MVMSIINGISIFMFDLTINIKQNVKYSTIVGMLIPPTLFRKTPKYSIFLSIRVIISYFSYFISFKRKSKNYFIILIYL